MEIKTQRLTLRPVQMEDLPTVHAYSSDRESLPYMVCLPYESIEETAFYVKKSVREWEKEQPNYCEFSILKDGEHIGAVTLYFLPDRTRADIGWILHRNHWRRGYASEAARALIDYAHKYWGVQRIGACCDSENEASYRVMEKLGMRRAECRGGRKNRLLEGERMTALYEMEL